MRFMKDDVHGSCLSCRSGGSWEEEEEEYLPSVLHGNWDVLKWGKYVVSLNFPKKYVFRKVSRKG